MTTDLVDTGWKIAELVRPIAGGERREVGSDEDHFRREGFGAGRGVGNHPPPERGSAGDLGGELAEGEEQVGDDTAGLQRRFEDDRLGLGPKPGLRQGSESLPALAGERDQPVHPCNEPVDRLVDRLAERPGPVPLEHNPAGIDPVLHARVQLPVRPKRVRGRATVFNEVQ